MPLRHTFTLLKEDSKPPPGAPRTGNKRRGNKDRRQSTAHQIPIRAWQPAGIPLEDWDQYLATCWLSSSRQPGGCHPVPRKRHPLRAGTKVVGPQGLPISMLVSVFNTGLNGKDKSQHPGLFLSREVLLFQLLKLVWLMHIRTHTHAYQRNVCFYQYVYWGNDSEGFSNPLMNLSLTSDQQCGQLAFWTHVLVLSWLPDCDIRWFSTEMACCLLLDLQNRCDWFLLLHESHRIQGIGSFKQVAAEIIAHVFILWN